MVEVNVLDRTQYIDRTDINKPVPMMMITFNLDDGRVGSVNIPQSEYNAEKEKVEIKKAIERLPPVAPGRITV